MFCHKCGIPRIPNAKFCPGCGCMLPDPSEFLGVTAAAPVPAPAPAVVPEPVPEVLPAPISEASEPAPVVQPLAVPTPVVPPIPPASPVVPPPAASPVPAPEIKKGRHRVPILIMVALVLAGFLLFLATAGKSAGSAPSGDTAPAMSETPWFRNEDGTLYFDAEVYTSSSELTIPDTVDGEPVVRIAEDCFSGSAELTTVILPDSLEEIGSGAFSGCTALRGIFIPDQVKLIGSGAFRDCTALEAITIPGSVEAIGYNAFRGCTKLSYILYDGKFEDWKALYSGTITTKTYVYCTDGEYPHWWDGE